MKRLSDRLISRINKLASLSLPQEEIASELLISQFTVSKYINMKWANKDKLETENEKGIRNQ